jgi:hypothetical protein
LEHVLPPLPPTKRSPFILVGIATFACIFVTVIAYVFTRSQITALRFIAAAPRATLASPRQDPAIYSGEIVAPADRTTPMGSPATAYWWWVDHDGDDNTITDCSNSAYQQMQLRDGDRTAPLALFDRAPDVALLAGDRDWDYDGRAVVDLGVLTSAATKSFPRESSTCAASDRRYSERWLPPRSRADVLACNVGGSLTACSGPLDGVLAVPDIRVHLRRRAGEVRDDVRIAAGVLIAFLFGIGLTTAMMLAGMLGLPQPRKGKR